MFFAFSTVRNRKKPQETASKLESSDALTEVCDMCIFHYELLFFAGQKECVVIYQTFSKEVWFSVHQRAEVGRENTS